MITHTQTQPEIDPRESAMESAHEMADLLCGDVVLVPFKDGEPDWESCDRQALEKVGGHWTEIQAEDVPRLAILTDGFDRFLQPGSDASVVTLNASGTPTIRQIDGEPSEAALDMIMDALINDVPLREFVPKARPANDNWPLSEKAQDRVAARQERTEDLSIRLESLRQLHGGEIRNDCLFGATVNGRQGQFRFIDGMPRFYASEGSQVARQPRKPIFATPFSLRDPSLIPPRDWLFAKHYIRKYLTVTLGAGGGGKSALAVSEVLSMVTGRPLLEPDGALHKPLRTWYINAEDPQEETERRFTAAALHFGITNADISDRLFTDSGREQEFVIMQQVGRDLRVCEPMINEMLEVIRDNQIDVVIVDPFVSTHEVPENDNSAVQRVAKAWLRVAHEGNCSVDVVHHVTKGNFEVTADSGRGGGALKDKARSVRTINPMTADEGKKSGVDDHRDYFRVDLGKANLAKASSSIWRKFVSINLRNNGKLLPGDSIGVVDSWRWPSRASKVADVPDIVLAGIKTRLANSAYKADSKGKPWAGDLIAECLGLNITNDNKLLAKGMLDAWVGLGEFEIVEEYDGIARKTRKIVRPSGFAPT